MHKFILVILSTIVLQLGFPCSCFPWNDNFYENIGSGSQIAFIRMDSTYLDTSATLPTPMAYFTLVRNFSIPGKVEGDTLLLYGQDGLNCAVGFYEFNIGDTLLAALSGGAGSLYSIPFFGSRCGVHHLRIFGGQHDGLDFEQIEAKIEDYITSSNAKYNAKSFSIKNNPVHDNIVEFTEPLPLNGRVIVCNYLGQVLIDLKINAGTEIIDVSELPAGAYQVIIKQNKSFSSKAIIKI